jgi:hypothetical protein
MPFKVLKENLYGPTPAPAYKPGIVGVDATTDGGEYTDQFGPTVKAVGDFGTGVLKEGAGVLKGLGTLGQGFLNQTAGRVVNAVEGKGFTKGEFGSDLYNPGSEVSNKVNEFLQPANAAQEAGKMGAFVATLFAQPEIGVEKLGMSGLTHLAEKGLLNPETYQTIVKVVTSKFGQAASNFLKNFVEGGAVQVGQNVIDEKPLTENVGTTGLISATGIPIVKTVFSKLAPPIINTLAKGFGFENPVIKKEFDTILKTGDEKSIRGWLTKQGVGDEGYSVLKSAQNPDRIPYQQGTKKLKDVVDHTESKIGEFQTNSFNEYQAVRDSIPKDIKGDPNELATRVDQGITQAFEGLTKNKGAQVEGLTSKEALNAVVDPNQKKVVENAIDTIKTWKDNSAQGILNLRTRLSKLFYKIEDGYNDSNKIIQGINTSLKDYVAELYPAIRPALQKASENIKLAEEFTTNLIGKGGAQGEARLKGILAGFKEPALMGEKMDLLKQLAEKTGATTQKDLQAYFDYIRVKAGTKNPGLLNFNIMKPLDILKKNTIRAGVTETGQKILGPLK